jgi:hypothetical protein
MKAAETKFMRRRGGCSRFNHKRIYSKYDGKCQSHLTQEMYLSCRAEIIEIIFLTVAAVVAKNEKESVMASRVWSTGICFGGSLESGGFVLAHFAAIWL